MVNSSLAYSTVTNERLAKKIIAQLQNEITYNPEEEWARFHIPNTE